MQLWLTRHREVRWGGRWLQRPVLHALSPPRISAVAVRKFCVVWTHFMQTASNFKCTRHTFLLSARASLVLCKPCKVDRHQVQSYLSGVHSERHCIHFSGGPGGTEPPIAQGSKLLSTSSYLIPHPLHSSSASRNQLPNKVCGPKSLFWALIWEQLKLK